MDYPMQKEETLQKQRQFDDIGGSCSSGNKPAKIYNIHCHASWYDLTQKQKTY